MRRITAAALTLGFGCALSGQPQSLQFEVASVRRSQPAERGARNGPEPGGERYQATNTSLKLLITEAYRVRLDQVLGGPDWADRERFDVKAKAERPSTVKELHGMLQSLLAERFQLRIHTAYQNLRAYGMMVDANGIKFRGSEAGAPFSFEQHPGEQPHQVTMKGRSVSMDYLAWRLGRVLDLPVVDLTTLPGVFDLDLRFIEEVPPEVADRAAMNGRAIPSHPSLFEALRQQLGLRLQVEKRPVPIIVVDHAERPSEN